MHGMPDAPRRSAGWFRPAGIDLGPQRSRPVPPVIPVRAQPILAHAVRAAVLLVILAVFAVGLLLAFVLHPLAALALLVGGFVVGRIVRTAWRATR